jgi:toxin-antitoxin system PIN domain toxin
MILVDANLLIYAEVESMADHHAAREWFQNQLEAGHRIGLPWQSILAFLRITTNPRVFPRPASTDQAVSTVEGWLKLPGVWTPGPTERHALVLGRLLRGARASGNLVTDAHLAAIAIGHGLELCSTDGDFARFDGLRWKNPLRS